MRINLLFRTKFVNRTAVRGLIPVTSYLTPAFPVGIS